MVKPIMRDLFFLRQKAEKATKGDFPVAIDLLDTLKAVSYTHLEKEIL